MDNKKFCMREDEYAQIPEHLRDRVRLAMSFAKDWDGKTVCTGLRPNKTGGQEKPCQLMDPSGLAAEWMRESKKVDQENDRLKLQLSSEGWQPIDQAPKDATPVDLWVPAPTPHRLTDMRRVELSNSNVFYEAIISGPSCERAATHFRLVPAAP